MADLDDVRASLRAASDELTQAERRLGLAIQELVDATDDLEDAPDRQVWTARIPEGDEYGVGPCEVIIERFRGGMPTIAFRRHDPRTGTAGVWSRPYRMGEQ